LKKDFDRLEDNCRKTVLMEGYAGMIARIRGELIAGED